MIKSRIGIIYIFCILFSCQGNTQNTAIYTGDYEFPFDLDKPSKSYKLDKDLQEISGLAWIADKEWMVAISDDRDELFFLDDKGDVAEKIEMGIKGDFEGVAFSLGLYYVISSAGEIFEIYLDWENREVTDVNYLYSGLSSLQEPEGLCVDDNYYYVACKGHPGLKLSDFTGKSIFRIHRPILMNRAEKFANLDLEQLNEKESGIKDKHNSFAFSGCAIDPLTGDFFVLSAVNEWLFVLDGDSGLLKYAKRFKEKGFDQPEGICFTPDGDLYVASEGKSEDAILLKYKRN